MFEKHDFDILIDDRNERPLTIALATIVMVWSLAFALTFGSAHLVQRYAPSFDSAATVSSSTAK